MAGLVTQRVSHGSTATYQICMFTKGAGVKESIDDCSTHGSPRLTAYCGVIFKHADQALRT